LPDGIIAYHKSRFGIYFGEENVGLGILWTFGILGIFWRALEKKCWYSYI
jgi:hypothetical protein